MTLSAIAAIGSRSESSGSVSRSTQRSAIACSSANLYVDVKSP
jgi:hypothetical protein